MPRTERNENPCRKTERVVLTRVSARQTDAALIDNATANAVSANVADNVFPLRYRASSALSTGKLARQSPRTSPVV